MTAPAYYPKRRVVDENGNLLLPDSVLDSAGNVFSPGSCSHVYGRDTNGLITTDTATDGTVIRIKTFTYTSGLLTGESKWVVQ